MSITSGIVLLKLHFVIAFSDLYNHWQRIYDLSLSIKYDDFWPKVALNGFNQIGSAFISMYPKLNLF